jgi:signal transduction histidine kinase
MTESVALPYASFSDEEKFVIGLWLRVVAASVFLVFLAPFTLLGIDFPYEKCFLAYYGLGALICSNGLYWYLGKASGFHIGEFYLHWCIDLVLISVVIYGLGGALLPSAITGYMLIVITSAVFVSRRAAFCVATGAAASYTGLIAAETFGVIDPKYDLGECFRESPGMRTFVVIFPVFMVYLVAFITGTLGDQLNYVNALLTRRNEDLNEQNERLDRMRSELEFQGKVLSHDIRSPVAAAYSALLELRRMLSGVGNGEKVHLIDVAGENLDRVEDMIEAIQQAREESEIAEGETEEVDLVQLIRELKIEFAHEFKAKKATLIVEDSLPKINGVRARLVVMFRNLLMNAVRYIPVDGRGLIRVGLIVTDAERLVFVRDNGPGIPREFHNLIFEMFKKVPQQTKSSGMGLGLALVKRVAEQHRGRAWVESDGKSGSTFFVAFPKADRDPRGA